MRSYIQSLLARIMPFVGLGIVLAFVVIAFVIFSYVLLIGTVIGLVLFAITYLKQRFFLPKRSGAVVLTQKKIQVFDNEGRMERRIEE